MFRFWAFFSAVFVRFASPVIGLLKTFDIGRIYELPMTNNNVYFFRNDSSSLIINMCRQPSPLIELTIGTIFREK